MSLPRLLFIACLMAALPPLVHAQAGADNVRYVDDVLTITVRTGRGTDFQILRTIESGLRVEVLESGADGYSQVRMPDGVTGWVLSRYLSRERPARERLAAAEAAAEQAGEAASAAQARAEALASENEAFKQQVSRLFQEREQLDAELDRLRATLGDPASAPAQLAQARSRVQILTTENEDLRAVNTRLRAQSDRNWFLTGAGVLLGGLVLGLILPRLRPRRRNSSWGSL